MKKISFIIILCLIVISCNHNSTEVKNNKDCFGKCAIVSIIDSMFYFNGKPTFNGREWKGYKIEGLIPGSRMVQGIFDDLNPNTVSIWNYPDTKVWDAERNNNEFVNSMEEWRKNGLISFTINLQGGSPFGYGNPKPWYNSAYTETGDLREEYMKRLKNILDRAVELEMIPIVGLFYFGQDQNLKNEDAVINATKNAVNWLLDNKYENILIELNNECNVRYFHEILKPERVHELIVLAKSMEQDGRRFLVSASYGGGEVPKPNVVKVSDYVLLHGNGVSNPDDIVELINTTRKVEGYKGQPIIMNEDDHYNFEAEWNNFVAATSCYVSWGYFDYRKQGEPFEQGFQSIPVDWGINSKRKKAFFNLLKEITGVE